jgi:photosystem II stability/assembly factor-like uncharacterized protein
MAKKIFFVILVFLIPTYAQYQSIWDQIPDNIRELNSFKRYEWFYRPRTDDRGMLPKEHIKEQKLVEEQKISLQKSSVFEKVMGTSDLWTNIGPKAIDMSSSFIPYWGANSGRIRGLAVHPTDANIVYVGAAAGGIWKTTNGGISWTDLSGDFNLLTFGAITIDPNNPNTVYAGTGESIWFFNNTTYEGDGLYKTTDGGLNWTRITNGFGSATQFADIDVNPGNSNILLAALGSGHWAFGNNSNEGVWRSTDAGVTWTKVINLSDAFDVSFHPSNVNLAYATIGNRSTSGGFYISTDAGATWAQSNTGLPSASTIGRMQFDLAPSSPSTIYSLIYNSTTFPSGHTTVAYKSTNSGASWSQISSGINIAGSYNGSTVSDQGSYDLCLDVNPTNANHVFFGNVELSRTLNGSTINFVRNPAGLNGGTTAWDCYTHVDIHKIIYAPSNSNYIYVACDGGIYRTTDGGSSWSNLNNDITTIQFYRIASDPSNANILFGGAQDNGNFSTNDKGANDWVFELSGDGMECFVDYSNPNYVFMSTQYGSLYRSTDGGLIWNNMVGSASSTTAWTAPYWQHPTNNNYIYAGWNRQIIRSTDKGNSWFYLSGTITTTNVLTSIAHSPVNTNNMIAIASNFITSPNIYRSTDEGITWSDITSNVTGSGFSGAAIFRVIADPSDANTFFICRASYSSGMVIKTTNFGTTWTNISVGLPSVPHNDLVVDPVNTNHLYVANDFGVYWTSDGGSNWVKLSNGMPFVPVLDFDFYSNAGIRYLRAATHGRGVYELNIDSPLPVELSSFSASIIGSTVKLNWSTETEINNYGFEIERYALSAERQAWEKIGFVNGNGNSNSPKSYSFTDNNVESGKYSYRLKQIDNDGQFEYSKAIEVDLGAPKKYELSQNYPNPFNPTTTIKFNLPEAGNVKLTLFNILGQELKTLVNEFKESGVHTINFDASDLNSGMYIYKLEAGSFVQTRKMTLVK